MPKLIIPSLASLDGLITRERFHLLRSELRWVYRGKTNPRYCNFWHHVPHTSAWLVLEGRASVRSRGEERMCSARAGEWLIQPPGERWHQMSSPCEILSICFVWRWVFGRELFPLSTGLTFPGNDIPGLREIGLSLADAMERRFPGVQTDMPRCNAMLSAHLEVESGFHTWLAFFASAMMQHEVPPDLMTLDPRVEQAVQMLDHPGREGLRPAEIARRLAISQGQMNRLFLRDLGTTVRGYCEERKFGAAQALLEASGLSVKEVAFRLGFRSPQHFSRWFKTRSGWSPSQANQHTEAMI